MSERKKKHRQPYPAEFREQMVALVRAGRTPDGDSRGHLSAGSIFCRGGGLLNTVSSIPRS